MTPLLSHCRPHPEEARSASRRIEWPRLRRCAHAARSGGPIRFASVVRSKCPSTGPAPASASSGASVCFSRFTQPHSTAWLLLTTGLPSVRSMSAIASICVVLVQDRNTPSTSGPSMLLRHLRPLRGVTLPKSLASRFIATSRTTVEAGRGEIVDHRLVALVGREQDHLLDAEHLQCFAAPAGWWRAPRCRSRPSRCRGFCLRRAALGHRRVGAVEHDQSGWQSESSFAASRSRRPSRAAAASIRRRRVRERRGCRARPGRSG